MILISAFMQSGAGCNSCLGESLARMKISKVTARDFDICHVNPGSTWSSETHFTAIPYGWPCCVQRCNACAPGGRRPLGLDFDYRF